MKLLSASVLSADFSILGDEVQAMEVSGADLIHVDVMDGKFVPNITIGPIVIEAISKSTILPIDVHLMIENPERYITDFISAGASSITIHQESCIHLHRVIQLIKEHDVSVGIALNPSTALDQVEWVLKESDFILVMSVNPGFGGQEFINSTFGKVAELKTMIEEMGTKTLIQVDGGINLTNIGDISRAGADTFVSGSTIFNSGNYRKTISALKAEILYNKENNVKKVRQE